MLTLRKSEERGIGNYGWLKAKYSFSFANYFDSNFLGLGDLLVINEDRIDGGQGFGDHPHKDMEIITYVIDGAVRHRDSMGHEGVVKHGEIQYMSAGTGVVHSEYNDLADDETHLLQIWIKPDREQYSPNYGQASYVERMKENELCLLVSNDGREGSIAINQDVLLYTAMLNSGKSLSYEFSDRRMGWIQLIKGSININGIELESGDGLALTAESLMTIAGKEDAEFLLFDLR